MQDLLSLYVQALRPILYIDDFDFYSIDNEIEELAKNCHAEIKEFSMGYGEIHFRKSNAKFEQYQNLLDFLELHENDGFDKNVFILLKDVHSLLDPQQGHADSQKIIARLRHIAEKNMYVDDYHATIFIVSGVRCIPKELEHLITLVSVERPEQPAIEELLKECASTLNFVPTGIGELALELKGLSRLQIKQILDIAYCNGGFISLEKDKHRIMDEKKQIIDKAGLLEFVKPDDSIDDVGGLGALCNWLEAKNRIFQKLDDALKMGLDTPRGVLILGVPGCGKSMTAKATASLFQKPLVRLDVGRLLGKYIGESESNMRDALKQAEAISPCVLWIDEIEKAFAGGSEHAHEVTLRLIGQFLTWMQEKKSTVFVVATANNIETLPPEFLRKGRFDEIFSVDLPDWEERVEILKIHLRKLKQSHKELNLLACKDITEHFSGADLRSGVCSALERAFIEGRSTITDDDLQKALKDTIPLYTAIQEEIDNMQKKLKKFNVKQARGERLLNNPR